MPIDISKFDRCNLLVVGDLMLDEYLWGEVDRISPEAPVQVVSIKNEDYAMGGAGNVVNNIIALGAKVTAAGVVGTGRNGRILLDKFKDLGVDTAGIVQEPGMPTTQKTRIIASHQHVLRIDRETDKTISHATIDKITRFIEDKIAGIDVVLISDYGKGLITKTLLSRLISAAQKHKKITIADPKGLDFSKYSGVSMLTPNKKEAALASGVEIVDESTLFESGHKILHTVGLDKLLITCGKDGMVLFGQNREPFKVKAKARQVFDVSGAGDTVLSVFGLAIAAGASFKDAMSVANTAAGIVVGKVGTATLSRQELATALTPDQDALSSKHKIMSELPALIQELKKRDKRIVMTNGCFDLLHPGHIMLFSASKELGDILIVGIDDDDSVKKLKGSGRPVIGVKERARILCALDSVDYVVVFSTGELTKLIEIIQPDVLTKGSNYTSEEVFGRERVEALGGKVVLIPVSENISSTRIINDIKTST
ncbi:MAG: D-glycero-beta-D-manno-heptose-7-phosphate kinase [Deltaproteobacteria bacterium]|nr:D-glycero-beta-D-manno-heptose-7-phosphate kinase [Deltaproteobacteria bacterium]MBW2089626.1 D-glycero-beta-D-manno-heptose-7-phosphate kinase [Deltaproteobacteria bacterium]